VSRFARSVLICMLIEAYMVLVVILLIKVL